LTNEKATTDAVRAALRRAAAAAGPDDLVMFFFSGHGDQVDVARSARELDGRAETIELYDEALRDTELEAMLNQVDGRMLLVAIDACYSGGFRNLVNRPNVMGLFSSEEDLTSLVAERREAGGYLSYYLRSGLAGERIMTGTGWSPRASSRLTFAGASAWRAICPQEPASMKQLPYLLVERGGIHIDDGIVRLGGGSRTAANPGAEIAAK
jgi:hypothetical protein